MTVTVLSAAHAAYRSGENSHALSAFNVADGAVAVLFAGVNNLETGDTAWLPTVTDAGRTWTLRGQNRTANGDIWAYDWFNDTGSTASVSATVVFPAMTYNQSVGHVVIEITDVADPAIDAPVVTKNPTGDTLSTTSASTEQVTLTPTVIGSQVVMGFASRSSTAPTLLTDTSAQTSPPASYFTHSGEGALGALWRTATESALTSITVGASAPTGASAGNIAIEYLPAAGGTPGTFTTSAGDAPAAGASASFTGAASFTASAGDAPSAGASATLTGAATFTASAGDAPAAGAAGSFTASATFTTSAGDASSDGAAASFAGAASFAANAGDATGDGGTASLIGAATGTFTALVGDAAASGSTASFTLPAPETVTPARILAATARTTRVTATARTTAIDARARTVHIAANAR